MIDGRCPKCGSSEVYRSQHPGGIWNEDARLLKVWTDAGPAIAQEWHTCVCTACGYCEFYLNDAEILGEIAGAQTGRAWSKIVPAAWLHDPSGRHELRYWDGSQWTSSVSDGGEQTEDPV